MSTKEQKKWAFQNWGAILRAKSDYCVYIMANEQNGRIYVGCTRNLEMRMNMHYSRLRRQKHYNKLLQADYNEGFTFRFEVIKEFKNADHANAGVLAHELEVATIHELRPYYNINSQKKTSLKSKRHAA